MKGRYIAFVVACLVLFCSGQTIDAQKFFGFELLDLDGALVKWRRADGSTTLRVSFAIVTADTHFANARNCPGLTALSGLLKNSDLTLRAFHTELRAAFDIWEKAAAIEFVESTNQQDADILIGAQEKPIGRAFANVAYKAGDGPVRSIERALICLNPQRSWKIGFDGNLDVYDLRYTLAHEIGHAIGLDHPSPTGQLMSFRYEENFRRLQAGDLSGVAAIYGTR